MDTQISLKLKRKIKRVKQKYGIPRGTEIKGSKSNHYLRIDVLKAISFLPIGIYSIAVNKQGVNKSLRNDTNILYNYMANLIMVPYLEQKKFNKVHIIADLRITKVA